jgi:hypothetical protein
MDVAFALTLNREVSRYEIDALYEVFDGDLEVETGPLGTVVEVYDVAMSGPPLLAAADAAARLAVRAVPAGWMIKLDGYGW